MKLATTKEYKTLKSYSAPDSGHTHPERSCWYSHVKQHVVLGTHSQVLPDGTHLSANVLPQDVGGARGGREQPRQDGPEDKNITAQESALTLPPQKCSIPGAQPPRAEASSLRTHPVPSSGLRYPHKTKKPSL